MDERDRQRSEADDLDELFAELERAGRRPGRAGGDAGGGEDEAPRAADGDDVPSGGDLGGDLPSSGPPWEAEAAGDLPSGGAPEGAGEAEAAGDLPSGGAREDTGGAEAAGERERGRPDGLTAPSPAAPSLTAPSLAAPALAAPSLAAPSLAEVIAEVDREVAAHPGEAEPAEAGARPAAEARRRYLLFSLAGTRCAVALDRLVELGGVPRVTPVPNLPAWVRGVTNLRGDILSVLDLAAFFEIGAAGGREPSRLLVVRSRGEEITTGLLAEAVHGLVDLPSARLRPPAAPLDDRLAAYLAGVAEHEDRLVSVLDLDRLLAAPELRPFDAVGGAG